MLPWELEAGETLHGLAGCILSLSLVLIWSASVPSSWKIFWSSHYEKLEAHTHVLSRLLEVRHSHTHAKIYLYPGRHVVQINFGNVLTHPSCMTEVLMTTITSCNTKRSMSWLCMAEPVQYGGIEPDIYDDNDDNDKIYEGCLERDFGLWL